MGVGRDASAGGSQTPPEGLCHRGWDPGEGLSSTRELASTPGLRRQGCDSPCDHEQVLSRVPPPIQPQHHRPQTHRLHLGGEKGPARLRSSLLSLLPCPQPVASLTRAGTVRVGPRLGQQVEKHIAQESPQGKAEQLLQAPGPSYKAEMRDLGAEAPEPLA